MAARSLLPTTAFGKSLWDLTLSLEQLRDVSAGLTEQHEQAHADVNGVHVSQSLQTVSSRPFVKNKNSLRGLRLPTAKLPSETSGSALGVSGCCTGCPDQGCAIPNELGMRPSRSMVMTSQDESLNWLPAIEPAQQPLKDDASPVWECSLSARGSASSSDSGPLLEVLELSPIRDSTKHGSTSAMKATSSPASPQNKKVKKQVTLLTDKAVERPPSVVLDVGSRSISDDLFVSEAASKDELPSPTAAANRMAKAQSKVDSAAHSLSHMNTCAYDLSSVTQLGTLARMPARLRDMWEITSDEADLKALKGLFIIKSCKTTSEKFVRCLSGGRRLSARSSDSSVGTASAERSHPAKAQHRHCALIIHPLGYFKLFWSLISLMLIMYDLFFIPLQVFRLPELRILFYIDWTLTVFWTVDLLLNFRTGYIIGSRIEMDSCRIAVHYAKTWLFVDFIIVLLEWAGRFLVTSADRASIFRISRAVRSLRLLRLVKLRDLMILIKDHVQETVSVQLVLVLLKLTAGITVMVHYTSCVWYAIGDLRSDGWITYASLPPCGILDTESSINVQEETVADAATWYVYSARWVLAQVNGRIDQDARRNMLEMGFTCLVALGGPLLLMAVFVSSMTATLMELNSLAQQRRLNRRLMHNYLANNNVSPELSAFMKQHLRHHEDVEEKHATEQSVLKMLPSQLQKDLLYEVRAPTIIEHKFFLYINKFSPRALRHLTMDGLRVNNVHHEEKIFEKDDACSRMLFAYRGQYMYTTTPQKLDIGTREIAKIYADEARVPDIGGGKDTGTGAWLCEGALWLEWRNQGTLSAYNDGCLFALDVYDFERCLRAYRDVMAIAMIYAKEFHMKLKAHGELSDIVEMEIHLKVNVNDTMRHQVTDFAMRIFRPPDEIDEDDGSVSLGL